MRYAIRTTNGQICCSGDNLAYLCAACKDKARFISPPGAAASGEGLRPSGVPPPPDLATSIRRNRAVSDMTQAERDDRVRQILAGQPRPMADGGTL